MEGVLGRSPGARLAAGVAAALVLLHAPACASGLGRHSGALVHPRGFRVADPAGIAPGWRPMRVKGTTLAYRGPAGATLSWMVGCRRPVAPPELLARHLLIGLHGRAVTGGEAVEVDGREGWLQRVSAREGGANVQMKSVTAVAGPCVLDWVLVAPEELGAAEPVFDAWWQSFRDPGRPDPRPGEESPGLEAAMPASAAPAQGPDGVPEAASEPDAAAPLGGVAP